MSYSKSGVSEEAATKWVEKITGSFSRAESPLKMKMRSQLGDYAAIYELTPNQWVAAACDGVGTKLLWTLAGLGDAKDLAQDLLAMTANDLLCVGATPRLFLDYMAIGRPALLSENGLLSEFIDALGEKCFQTGQLLVGGETAQLPDLYQGDHFDLAGFGVGFLEPSEALRIDLAKEGDELWAWKSSGPHSNGYSWLRKVFDGVKDKDFIHKHLMKPTHLYVNEFNDLRQSLKAIDKLNLLRSAYHITGTGFLNLLRKQPPGRKLSFELSLEALGPKPIWVQELINRQKGTELKEFYNTFNMGAGFCILFAKELIQGHRNILENAGLLPLGKLVEKKPLVVDGVVLSQ